MTHLYAIKDCATGYIKIGYSVDPRARMNDLQVGCAGRLELIHAERVADSSARLLESGLHRELNHYRVRGEWFSCDESFVRSAMIHHIIRWGNGLDE